MNRLTISCNFELQSLFKSLTFLRAIQGFGTRLMSSGSLAAIYCNAMYPAPIKTGPLVIPWGADRMFSVMWCNSNSRSNIGLIGSGQRSTETTTGPVNTLLHSGQPCNTMNLSCESPYLDRCSG